MKKKTPIFDFAVYYGVYSVMHVSSSSQLDQMFGLSLCTCCKKWLIDGIMFLVIDDFWHNAVLHGNGGECKNPVGCGASIDLLDACEVVIPVLLCWSPLPGFPPPTRKMLFGGLKLVRTTQPRNQTSGEYEPLETSTTHFPNLTEFWNVIFFGIGAPTCYQ